MNDDEDDSELVCPLCGQHHRIVRLRRGDRAFCGRCGAVLATRGFLGADAPFALTLTSLFLAVPAAMLPWVTVATLGERRASPLFGAVEGLWHYDMRLLAVWVFLCGAIAPLCLLLLLTSALLRARVLPENPLSGALERAARFVQSWAMPEVQILGVLVAFFKLGDIVDVDVGPGLWCYGAMSLAMILAWRGYSLPRLDGATPRRQKAEARS